MKNINVIFMGTPEFGVPLLKELINIYNVVLVVCQPDVPNKKVSPIKQVALDNGIPLFQPEDIRSDFQAIVNLRADIIITCAYGQILPRPVLEAARLGCVNVHASLLPKLRGGAPIHRAIMNGDEVTGITIMFMIERMDAGPIIKQREVKILSTDNVGILHDRLSIVGCDLMIDTLPDIISGNINPQKQDESQATYAPIIERKDEHINFEKSKREIYNKVRALNPFPGAYCVLESRILKVWDIRISDEVFTNKFDGEIVHLHEDGIGVKVNNGEIVLTEVQLEGRKRMKTSDFLNGLKDKELLIGKIFD